MPLDAIGIKAVEVIGAELLVGAAGPQHVVDHDQQAVRHGHHGLVAASPPSNPRPALDLGWLSENRNANGNTRCASSLARHAVIGRLRIAWRSGRRAVRHG